MYRLTLQAAQERTKNWVSIPRYKDLVAQYWDTIKGFVESLNMATRLDKVNLQFLGLAPQN